MAAGLILAVFALFMAPMSVGEIATRVNRSAYVEDQLEVLMFDESGGEARLEYKVLSTGERFVTDRMDLVGLERLRQLEREGKAQGFRVPVYSLASGRFGTILDKITPFRVRSPGDFEYGFPAGLIAFNAAMAVAGVALIRRGATPPEAPTASASPPRPGRPRRKRSR